MRKFFKSILLFAMVVLIVYPFLIFLAGYFPIPQALKPNLSYRIVSSGYMFTRIKEAKQLNSNLDILFLGSSHSYRGFDPRNFRGKNTFNLGSSSQTPIQTKILLERYLSSLKPKMVIYEVYPGSLSMDGVESSLDLIANDKNDFKSIKMAFELNNIKIYNTLIYAGIEDIFNINKNNVGPIKQGKDTYISGGFVESEIRYYKFATPSTQEWNLKEKQLKVFNECIELLKKRNIKTILVYAPITAGLYNSYKNNDFVDSIFSSYQLEYLNFNKLIKLNDSLHFYDAHHLNQNGVELFNKKLIEILNL
ncbi:MAG: hypothetical protein QM727_15675 [Niabella sp.]